MYTWKSKPAVHHKLTMVFLKIECRKWLLGHNEMLFKLNPNLTYGIFNHDIKCSLVSLCSSRECMNTKYSFMKEDAVSKIGWISNFVHIFPSIFINSLFFSVPLKPDRIATTLLLFDENDWQFNIIEQTFVVDNCITPFPSIIKFTNFKILKTKYFSTQEF